MTYKQNKFSYDFDKSYRSNSGYPLGKLLIQHLTLYKVERLATLGTAREIRTPTLFLRRPFDITRKLPLARLTHCILNPRRDRHLLTKSETAGLVCVKSTTKT